MRAAALASATTSPSCAPPTRSRRSARAACASSRSKAGAGYPASCTTLVADGMKVRTAEPEADAAPPQRDGALCLRPSARLRLDLPANGTASSRTWPAQLGVTGSRATASTARTTCTPRKDESNPYFTFDQSECIVCSRCVRACDEVQGTFALTIQGRGFEFEGLREPERAVPRLRVRVVRRVRRGVPDRRAGGEVAHPDRPADRTVDDDHVRVLRRRLLVQRRVEGRRSRPHGARTATATPTTATPASKAASRTATRRTAIASPRR